jgi:hypothetical protein
MCENKAFDAYVTLGIPILNKYPPNGLTGCARTSKNVDVFFFAGLEHLEMMNRKSLPMRQLRETKILNIIFQKQEKL